MFQNSYQNGNYFQIFDPKTPADKIKNLFKTSNSSVNNKIFDKDLKTYVLQFNSSTSKIQFPKQDKKQLYLIQQYIVFQIYFYPGMSWSMQLVISDLNKTKRRIMLSPTNHKLEIKPFFVKTPNLNFKEGVWNNLIVDLYSYMEAFKGQTYRCLDNILINGHFKLRRIYTTNSIAGLDNNQGGQITQSMKQINLLPKNFFFPPDIEQVSLLNKYSTESLSQMYIDERTEPSTKNNSSYLKSTKNRISTPKVETVKSQKIVQVNHNQIKNYEKQFLANTNGPEMLNRLRKRQTYNQSSDSQSQITDNLNTPSSSQKVEIKSKKKLIKTQIMPPKVRSSVQNRQKSKIQQKQKIKSKLNPWRTNAKRSQTSKLNAKGQSDLQSSPNTTFIKINNNNNNKFNQSNKKGFDRKSDHYSQSEYIELSQKFSTVTDGKFFNHNRSNHLNNDISRLKEQNENYDNQDEIEENIEMETNSMYSNSNKKKQHSPERQQIINESICDSLDRKSPKKDFEVIGRQSYYGLAERMMENYMYERRPFSPPLHQREHTEEDELPSFNRNSQNQQKEVELVYDPVLNCYYDHKTHTYYELKN